MIDIIYEDKRVLLASKPFGVISIDMPGILKEQTGQDCIRFVHRLDAVTGGLMLFAKSAKADSILSEEIRNGRFHKKYLAVTEGMPAENQGEMRDLLFYDKGERKAFVREEAGKDVKEAALKYEVLSSKDNLSLLEIELLTGRTHQIRAQLSSRGFPIYGDKKYGAKEQSFTGIALWSHKIMFIHPETGEEMSFSLPAPDAEPWNKF